MAKVHVILARYSDGSGEPELIKAFQDADQAIVVLAMIEACSPMKQVKVIEVDLDTSEYDGRLEGL